MARKVFGRPAGQIYPYIYEELNNREDSTPVTVGLLAPTEEERRELISMETLGDLKDTLQTAKYACQKYIKWVKNYTDTCDKPITSGDDMAAKGETPFVLETLKELLDSSSLREEEKKVLQESQVST